MLSPSALMSASAEFYEALYADYRRDPSSVDTSWRVVFELADELRGDASAGSNESADGRDRELAALLRSRGHIAASLDPLNTLPPTSIADLCESQGNEELSVAAGARESDTEELPALIRRLRDLYCGNLTLESAHIDDGRLRRRLREVFEARGAPAAAVRRRALDLLIRAESFERLIGARYPTKKRFGAEGAESIVPLLERILRRAAESGTREAIIGTMHRGRLNLLANVLHKPLEQLFAEIVGAHPLADPELPADVPYHLGYNGEVAFDSAVISVSLTPNPSHLEAVNPVALGRTRARQDRAEKPADVLCILLHTDASVIGQGVVAETVQLSELAGYRVGGTIHLIINNQVGFTTNPDEARSSRYCTGSWKAVDCPILHVNGDAVDEVLTAADLAVSFRAEHGRDVVLDFICYRRNGHNEVDEPRFTQPLEYGRIDAHKPVREQYEDRLRSDGLLEADYGDGLTQHSRDEYERALAAALASREENSRHQAPADRSASRSYPATGVAADQLESLTAALAAIPSSLTLDQKVARIVSQRLVSLRSGIPWALGEALAFGSLLIEGHPVRLSGQDVARGAFSHRHFVLTDTRNGARHVTLNHLAPQQASFAVINSPLSEYAVLGFEYGYSLERPEALTVWEAQFGDFANGAQIIIDQFVISGAAKWGQRSNLVLLLPHGLEGQGPEHSSGRPERYLQLAAGGNFELAHPTTPANYFHLLRRQVLRDDPIPLVVLSPKTLLRLPAAVSPLAAFAVDEHFQPVIVSAPRPPSRVLICSGKIAYQLEEEREKRNAQDTAVVRIELLYPFPDEELLVLFRQWRNARFIWVQEEPQNYGAWHFLDRRLERLLRRAGASCSTASCVSRPEQGSPAGSFHSDHERHQRELVARAFGPHEAVAARTSA
jgi:2-oxoglutarate dehydrogenase E1 component